MRITVRVVAAVLALGWAAPVLALGVIEVPAPGRIATGIGLISGWHCDGGVIQVRIDDGELITTASGTPREDTSSVCGRTDTGFGVLWNFNLLDPTQSHRVVAYADGHVRWQKSGGQ